MQYRSSERRRPRVARGLTLIEVVISTAATAILLVGMTSAIVLTTRALPENRGATLAVRAATDVVDQLSNELLHAVNVTESTSTAITFTVADRNGDGSPERIRYAWSGTVGTALTRQYNGGTAVNVLDNVNQFALVYDTKNVSETYPGPPVEGAEVQISSYPTVVATRDRTIDQNNWMGQFIQPNTSAMVPTPVSWRLTRVQIWAKRSDGSSQLSRVEIRAANADRTPTTTILDEVALQQTTLGGSYAQKEFAFSNVFGLSPSSGVCLLIARDTGGAAAVLNYDDSGGSARINTTNKGNAWTVDTTRSMRHYAYGKFTTIGPDQTAIRSYLTGVRITLQGGADSTARVDTAVRLLNAPEMLAAVWALDFTTNPTTLDMNADGVGDWVRHDGQAFNPASLSGGVWSGDNRLDTRPVCDFTQITTADVSFRNKNPGANETVFLINADWSGGTYAPLVAKVKMQSDQTQTLTVYHKLNDTTLVALVSVPGLPDAFVNLRLLIDPGYNTVNVRVEGVNRGTFTYNTFAPTGSDHCASMYADGSYGAFQAVRVRVGGTH